MSSFAGAFWGDGLAIADFVRVLAGVFVVKRDCDFVGVEGPGFTGERGADVGIRDMRGRKLSHTRITFLRPPHVNQTR